MQGELRAFGEHLKERDLARVALENEQLAFRRGCLFFDREERQRDGKERKQDGEANNRLELEKLKTMTEFFSTKKDSCKILIKLPLRGLKTVETLPNSCEFLLAEA